MENYEKVEKIREKIQQSGVVEAWERLKKAAEKFTNSEFYKKIKEIIDAGELGDIIYMDCSRMNLGKVKNDVSAMWDLSVHDLSIIDYLSNGAKVKTVNSMGRVIYRF